ncbi:MAG: TMEM165/GDT1 family protein [Candidatus Caldarchaeum sp.]|nr:TMEM165/GDT1 family protein [Candidatus Caldarchaeum sp.]
MKPVNPIDEAVKRYQTTAVVAAILVHFFIFITAIVVMVVLKQPLPVFIATHVGLQLATILNALFGHRLYRRYLSAKMTKQIVIN